MTRADRHGVPIAAGYRTFTGYRMTQSEADAYNRISKEIDGERWEPTRKFLMDQRHRLLVAIATEGVARTRASA